MKIRQMSESEILSGFHNHGAGSLPDQQRKEARNGFEVGVRNFENGAPLGLIQSMPDCLYSQAVLAGFMWRSGWHASETVPAVRAKATTDPANGGPGGTMGDAAAAINTHSDWCDCEPSHRSGTFRGKDGCMRCYSCDCKVRDAHPPADVTSGVEATMAISAPEPRVQAEQPLNLADRSFATLSALTVLASNAPTPPADWGDIDSPGEQPDRYASWAVAWATKLIERSEMELAKRAMAQNAASKAYGIKPKYQPGDAKKQRLVVNISNLPLVRTGQGDYTIDFYG